MIPLGRWLRENPCRAAQQDGIENLHQPPCARSAIEMGNDPEPDPRFDRPEVDTLRETAEGLQRQIEELRAMSARREHQLLEQVGSALASRLTGELKAGFACLQGEIEDAITQVLMPFLGECASRRATDELQALLRQAMTECAEPLLEVKAPKHIRPHLEALMNEQPALSFTEADEIELVFSSGFNRFEGLAAQWMDLMRKAAT